MTKVKFIKTSKMKQIRIKMRKVATIVASLAARVKPTGFKFVAVLMTATAMGFASCDKEDNGGELLPGQVFIIPAGPVAVGSYLAAFYTEGDIPEKEMVQVTFQWKNGKDKAEGTPTTEGNQSVYIPNTPGEYSVVASAPGYQSKPSNVVVVTEAPADGPGTSVAAKYRGVYPSTMVNIGGITLAIGENSITWTGASTGSFPNVSTGSEKTMNWALGGNWAYLYSGNNKIGIVWRYSAYGISTLQNFFIGHDRVALYATTILSSMGITPVDYSDIADTVPNMEGEIES
jgi:hypothetical protein